MSEFELGQVVESIPGGSNAGRGRPRGSSKWAPYLSKADSVDGWVVAAVDATSKDRNSLAIVARDYHVAIRSGVLFVKSKQEDSP